MSIQVISYDKLNNITIHKIINNVIQHPELAHLAYRYDLLSDCYEIYIKHPIHGAYAELPNMLNKLQFDTQVERLQLDTLINKSNELINGYTADKRPPAFIYYFLADKVELISTHLALNNNFLLERYKQEIIKALKLEQLEEATTQKHHESLQIEYYPKVLANELIPADIFLELCNLNNIKVPIKTIGAIKAGKLSQLASGWIVGSNNMSLAVCKYYKQLQAVIQ